MEIIVTADTDVQALVGRVFRTENWPPFTLLTVDHEPVRVGGICYGYRAVGLDYLGVACLPYGKALIEV